MPDSNGPGQKKFSISGRGETRQRHKTEANSPRPSREMAFYLECKAKALSVETKGTPANEKASGET